MSAHFSQLRQRSLPNLRPSRPQLSLVPSAAVTRVSRVPFAVLMLLLLTVGLTGLLLLNTSLQRGAYVVTDLQSRAEALTHQQQQLETSVQAKSDPQNVARSAARLGMVQAPAPAFINVATGEISGRPRPGQEGGAFLNPPARPSGPEKASSLVVPATPSASTGPITVKPERDSSGPGPRSSEGQKPADTRRGSNDGSSGRDRTGDTTRTRQ